MRETITRKNFYRYFFYLFLLSIPLQTRKVFLTEYSFYTGSFTEYGTIFLYLSDIILILAFVSLLIFNSDITKKGLAELKNKSGKITPNKIFNAMLLLLAWFVISALANRDYPEISLFRLLKSAEMILLAFFIFSTIRDKHFLSSSLFIIAISGFLQSILSIYQFVFQHNLFTSPLLHKLTGETILSPALPGIAKIGEGGEKLIRAYGTLPHPNLLGGFLIFSFFISLFLYLCHKDKLLSRFYFRLNKRGKRFNRYIASTLWIVLFTSQLLALTLTFSRSAWIGGVISSTILIYFLSRYTKIVSRETIFKDIRNRCKEMTISALILLSLVISNFSLFSDRLYQNISIEASSNSQSTKLPQNNTFADRSFFNIVSRETISQNPLLGSGPGTAVFQIEPYLQNNSRSDKIESWQYQPPHNLYLLSASELGIPGFLIFIYLIIGSIKQSLKKIVSRETISSERIFKACILSILSGLLFIGFFDHYLWTLQQGQIVFWASIGLLLI
ncbi:MAG: O-antigen ligase family protein [Candidatus Pacebacteria bacterium]|nr:O-antigen ligase family protein [Candidatus Paceibacterota bacterium]